MNGKTIQKIIDEMRMASEATIRAAGEGETIDLAKLTVIIDSWRFGLQKLRDTVLLLEVPLETIEQNISADFKEMAGASLDLVKYIVYDEVVKG